MMVLAPKVLLLIGLIRLLTVTGKPVVCAGIYAVAAALFSLMFESPILYILIATPISFGLALLYFWLLDRFEETGWHLFILVGGLLIGLV